MDKRVALKVYLSFNAKTPAYSSDRWVEIALVVLDKHKKGLHTELIEIPNGTYKSVEVLFDDLSLQGFVDKKNRKGRSRYG